LPPGPTAPAIVQALAFGRDPYAFLERGARRYGHVFTMRFPGDPPRVVVSEPALVRRIFALEPDDIRASAAGIPVNLGDRSLLFLDGEAHRRDRKVLTPPLHGHRLEGYARVMHDVTEQAIARLVPGTRVSLQKLLQDITLEIILRCVFGVRDRAESERIGRPVVEWLDGTFVPAAFFAGMLLGWSRVRRVLERAAAQALARSGGGPASRLPWRRVGRAKAEVVLRLRADLQHCRVHGTAGRTDILAMLADARYEDGSAIGIDHAVDELVTMLVGGHETTANTLAWTLSHVLPRPDVLARIDAERAERLGPGRFDPGRCAELVYLDACIKESMRRTPIAPAVSRMLGIDFEIGSWRVPAGTILFPCTYVTHHRPDLWEEPHAFRPERFLGADKPGADTFFPFGGGRRSCIGMTFARFEMRIVLATLLASARLRLVSDAPKRPMIRGLTVAPHETDAVVERVGR
jgi:hypothetical protein